MDLKEALRYLQEGYTLILQAERTFVHQFEEVVYLHNDQWHTRLSLSDFEQLYANNRFILYETQEQTIDTKKDEEYYQWAERNQ